MMLQTTCTCILILIFNIYLIVIQDDKEYKPVISDFFTSLTLSKYHQRTEEGHHAYCTLYT